MKLEAIRKMNTAPFDDDVLRDIYFQPYGPATISDGFALIILLYFKKFDELYGTRLTKGVYLERMLPCYMEDSEHMMWVENIETVTSAAMDAGGWNIEWFMAEEVEQLSMLEGTEDSKELFYEGLKQFLDGYFEEGFIKSCLLQEQEEIWEASKYLEESQIGVFWNSSLERYKKYRRENRDVVAEICPEENYYISSLQEDIWNPFITSFVHKTAVCGEMMYGMVILGSDGYDYCSSYDVDPNWIPKAVKLGWMLQLALEKIDCYEEAGRGREAV